MAQQLRSGMTSVRRAIASAAPSKIDTESSIVSASWCIGLAAFTLGYCFGRIQGVSEAERRREKEMRAWEKSQQAQLEAAVASVHAHIDVHNAEIAELLAHIGLWQPYQDFMKGRQSQRGRGRSG